VSLKKYIPRSIQNVFDRLEAFNESIVEKLFSEDLDKTFEVVVYCSKNPETKTETPAADLSPNVANYNFFKARSTVGHHDHLIAPQSAKSIDEYERLRNLHFQAILKKSSDQEPPVTGDVWLATQSGAGIVSLISRERKGDPKRFIIPEGDGPARDAHTNTQNPTTTVGSTVDTEIEETYGPPYPSPGLTSTPTSNTALPTLDATQRKILAFISKGEGSHDASNNGTKKRGTTGPSIVNSFGKESWVAEMNVTETKTADNQKLLSTLTIGEIKAFQGWTGSANTCALNQTFTGPRATRTLFAVGAYQIIPATMAHVLKDTGYADDLVFTKEIQDAMGLTLIYGTKRSKLRRYLKGSNTIGLFKAQLDFAQEWASIPDPIKHRDGYIDSNGNQHPPGESVSYYGSGNKAGHTLEEVTSVLKEIRAHNILQGYTEQ